MANGIQREPCFWLTTSEDASAERVRVRMVNGRKVVERLPQVGHDGDYENKTHAKGRRYIMVVRHEGHIVPLLLTNAAAHLTHGPYGQHMLAKGKHHGWYPEGACPCALFVSGELTSDQVVSPDVRNGTPCEQGTHSIKNPCKHDLAERAARTAQWNADQAERYAAFRDPDEKMREANKELLAGVAKTVVETMAAATVGKRKAGE
jgi:hypothetical protein